MVSSLSGREHTREIELSDTELAALMRFLEDRTRAPLIQAILPSHSLEDREFLLSGITPEEWESAFG